MALRARKVSGAFEKQAPDVLAVQITYILCDSELIVSLLYLQIIVLQESFLIKPKPKHNRGWIVGDTCKGLHLVLFRP